MGLTPAVAVLKTNNPLAGEVIGVAAVVDVSATRGGKNPFVVEFTSNWAEALGVFVPIPTCECTQKTKVEKTKSNKNAFLNIRNFYASKTNKIV